MVDPTCHCEHWVCYPRVPAAVPGGDKGVPCARLTFIKGGFVFKCRMIQSLS